MEECNCAVYQKAIPSEIIEIGDIVMLDPDTSLIKRAVATNMHEHIINSRLIVGVCTEVNNDTGEIIIIDGGPAKELDRILFYGGNSLDQEHKVINGGTSDANSNELVKVAYQGTCLVNIRGYVDFGDQLCISSKPGKAKSKDFLDREYFKSRSIGKVIKFTNTKNQVKVLLNIE